MLISAAWLEPKSLRLLLLPPLVGLPVRALDGPQRRLTSDRTVTTALGWPARLLSAALLLAPSWAAAAPLRLEFEPTAVVISSVPAAAEVILFGVSHAVDDEEGVLTISRRLEQLRDEDGDGVVRLDLGGPVPKLAVWAAVELASGENAVAGPPGSRLRRVNWRGRGLVTGRADRRDAIADARSYAQLLVVRPGSGAWHRTIGDGTPADEDGAMDGQFEVVLDSLESVRGAPVSTPRFAPKDVVILIDPNSLEITLVKVGEVAP